MNYGEQITQTNICIQEVLKPIIYADIFDFPLTFEEVYQFLEIETNRATVKSWLQEALIQGQIIQVENFYCLANRPYLIDKRRERQLAARKLWPEALYYGRWIASLPFVRMVSITGSLAVENPRHSADDIDFLIVTRSERLWLCRAMIILMVKYGHRQGVHLCPNYIITENLLHLKDKNLFMARQLLQMVPIYGGASCQQMEEANPWVTDYLPQARLNLDKIDDDLSSAQTFFKRTSEFILRGYLGDWLEKPLRKVQIAKHTRQAKQKGVADRVIFTADECKGHYDGHDQKTMAAYHQRRKQIYG